jgi:DNA-binding CsgD family transcriptional regulator
MLGTLSETFEDRILENEEVDLVDTAISVLQGLGIDHVCYLRIKRPNVVGCLDIRTNYNSGWFCRYLERNYVTVDPVVQLGLSNHRTLNWAKIDSSERPLLEFFGEAREHGVHSCGLSVQISDTENRKALFSMNSAMPVADWNALIAEKCADLRHLAYLFHTHHIRRQQPIRSKFPQLSPRELQVLSWAAAGKSCWETSQILNLSEKTVDGYMQQCYKKLKSNNKAQAVAVAAHSMLLDDSIFARFDASL